MRLVDILDYQTTLELEAADLLTLAGACHFAALTATLPNLPVPLASLPTRAEAWGLLGLFFEAAALASEVGPRASLPAMRACHARRAQHGSDAPADEVLRRLHERMADAVGEEVALEVFSDVLGEPWEEDTGEPVTLPTGEALTLPTGGRGA